MGADLWRAHRIGIGTEAPGLEQPVMYWDPSIAPSGLMIYSGEMFPEWRGDVFIGSLKFDYLSRGSIPMQGYAEERIEDATDGTRARRAAGAGRVDLVSVGERRRRLSSQQAAVLDRQARHARNPRPPCVPRSRYGVVL
jgi:hypothetical protein